MNFLKRLLRKMSEARKPGGKPAEAAGATGLSEPEIFTPTDSLIGDHPVVSDIPDETDMMEIPPAEIAQDPVPTPAPTPTAPAAGAGMKQRLVNLLRRGKSGAGAGRKAASMTGAEGNSGEISADLPATRAGRKGILGLIGRKPDRKGKAGPATAIDTADGEIRGAPDDKAGSKTGRKGILGLIGRKPDRRKGKPDGAAGDTVAGKGDKPEAEAARKGIRQKIGRKKKADKQAVVPENTEPGLVMEPIDQGVVEINGKPYAVGLTWVSVVDTDPLKSHIETARKLAISRKMADNDFTLVAGDKLSGFYGFAAPDRGHKRGLPVLIESFNADVMGMNWLAVHPIAGGRDLWWVGGRRGDEVFEDRILTSKEAASALFSENLDAPNWNTIIAPTDWRVLGSATDFPAGALIKPHARLRVVDPIKAYGPRAILATILIGALAAGGYYFWDKQQTHKAEMEELRRQIERAISLEPRDHPWFHRTSLGTFLVQCAEEMSTVLIFTAGWENEPVTCRIERGRGTISTGWRRAGGNTAWLRAAMPADFPSLTVNRDFGSATVSRQFESPIDPEAMRTEPWSRQMIEDRLAERFQLHDVTLNMRYVADTRPAETNPLFHRHDLQIQGSMDLVDIYPLISDIPALIPETVVYNLANASWSLIARIHHPVIVPEITP